MKQAFGLRLGLRRIGSPKVPKVQNQAFGLRLGVRRIGSFKMSKLQNQAFGLRLGLRRIGSPKVPKVQNQAFGLKPDRFSQCVQTPESGLRLESGAPNPTDYRQTQARREYI